jgi:glycosyltransferase involved in cell wall biosynthesis
MLRIVVNGRFLDRKITGVERFAREVLCQIEALVSAGDSAVAGIDFVIARPVADTPIDSTVIPEVRFGPFGGQAWEQFTLPRFARGDVIINLCNLAPLASMRNVVCVHDAHPWLIPQNFSWAFRKWYDFAIPQTIRRAARWVTVSEYSGRMLQELRIANRPPDAITYNAADTFQPASSQSSLVSDRLTGPYVLCLGSQSANKNISLIAGIAPQLRERGISVAIAGGDNSKIFGGGGSINQDNVILLGRVSDQELADLYANALAFLFPSLYEGFGIPAIEAMRSSCPVIASNTSALPEVLGDAAVLLDPHAPNAWLAAIKRIRDDATYRDDLIHRGKARAESFSWERSARTFVRLAREVSR